MLLKIVGGAPAVAAGVYTLDYWTGFDVIVGRIQVLHRTPQDAATTAAFVASIMLVYVLLNAAIRSIQAFHFNYLMAQTGYAEAFGHYTKKTRFTVDEIDTDFDSDLRDVMPAERFAAAAMAALICLMEGRTAGIVPVSYKGRIRQRWQSGEVPVNNYAEWRASRGPVGSITDLDGTTRERRWGFGSDDPHAAASIFFNAGRQVGSSPTEGDEQGD